MNLTIWGTGAHSNVNMYANLDLDVRIKPGFDMYANHCLSFRRGAQPRHVRQRRWQPVRQSSSWHVQYVDNDFDMYLCHCAEMLTNHHLNVHVGLDLDVYIDRSVDTKVNRQLDMFVDDCPKMNVYRNLDVHGDRWVDTYVNRHFKTCILIGM